MRPIALLLVAVLAGAQQPAPQAGNVRFSSTTNLVVVDVTVKDKSGKAIEGLKASDFTVTEDGKPQKVVVFEAQKLSMEPAPPEPPPALGDKDDVPDAPRTMITTQHPGEIQYHDKRLMVMFFDFSSMGMPEQLRAQEAAL